MSRHDPSDVISTASSNSLLDSMPPAVLAVVARHNATQANRRGAMPCDALPSRHLFTDTSDAQSCFVEDRILWTMEQRLRGHAAGNETVRAGGSPVASGNSVAARKQALSTALLTTARDRLTASSLYVDAVDSDAAVRWCRNGDGRLTNDLILCDAFVSAVLRDMTTAAA